MSELDDKLETVRRALAANGLGAIRLRGVDWFAWISCGGSSTVILTAEAGVAEVLVTGREATVLTDVIEAARLREEELPKELSVRAVPWTERGSHDRFAYEQAGGSPIASDRPLSGEVPLPPELLFSRWRLHPAELLRYRTLGRETAEAMTDVLTAARPEWTGLQLAGAASEALWSRGIHPTLALVRDARRLPLHRHPTAAREPLGRRAMLVVCARRHGLYANQTRFVYFTAPTADERRLHEDVAEVEADAFDASVPGAALGEVYDAIRDGYAQRGYPGAEALHHQGGTCGYLSRDVLALPGLEVTIEAGTAVAWNPSLPGAKIEDTAVVSAAGVEILGLDSRWPSRRVRGRARPDLLVR